MVKIYQKYVLKLISKLNSSVVFDIRQVQKERLMAGSCADGKGALKQEVMIRVRQLLYYSPLILSSLC